MPRLDTTADLVVAELVAENWQRVSSIAGNLGLNQSRVIDALMALPSVVVKHDGDGIPHYGFETRRAIREARRR